MSPSSVSPEILTAYGDEIGEISPVRDPACVIMDGEGDLVLRFLVFAPEGPGAGSEVVVLEAMLILVWMSFFFFPSMPLPVSLEIGLDSFFMGSLKNQNCLKLSSLSLSVEL